MLIYDNEYQTKEHQNLAKDKIELLNTFHSKMLSKGRLSISSTHFTNNLNGFYASFFKLF